APHGMVPPQPSAITPQFMWAGHSVMGEHEGVPQTFGVPPPPQIVPPVHAEVPQSRTPPQPSATIPHSPGPHVVFFTHAPPSGPCAVPPPQTLGTPPPPQTWGGAHVPQSSVTSPQPSGCGPQRPG